MFEKLIKWSHHEFSDLPWRKNRSLYGTLVSEIMLQQTTVGTVLNHYDKFLVEYPSLKKLANASEEQICISWKGLGYYRRARNLRKAAIDIVEQYKGKFPKSREQLIQISGIGAYTANAILSIGMDEEFLAIDANLERVLSRIFKIDDDKGIKLQKKIDELFNNKKIISQREKYSFRDLNEALMDLGRIYCKANKVQCDICPMRQKCEAFKLSNPLDYPHKIVKKDKKYYDLKLLKIIVKRGTKIIATRRLESEWLSGQIEIPTFILSSEDKSLKQYPKLRDKVQITNLKTIKTSITKYKITNYIINMNSKDFKELTCSKAQDFKYFELSNSNFTTTTSKSLTV